MQPLIDILPIILVSLLFAGAFCGMAFSLLISFREGAEVYAQTHAEETAKQLEDIFLFIPPKRIADIARAAAVLLFATFFFAFGDISSGRGAFLGVFFGTIGAVFAFMAPGFILKVLKKRRLERFNEQLVDGLMTMSNALRAGFSILQSFETIVKEGNNPIAQEFNLFLQQTRVGVTFDDALRELEERVGSQDLTLMIRAIETARITGGNLTEVFEKIAETIRERARIEGRIKSLTAQGRMQAIVVGSIPLLLLMAMTMMDPKMMMSWMTSAMGISMLVAVVIFEIIGFLIIRKIIMIDV